ncbi:chitinase [Lachancea thermotolerans CBS 6340]|uniref:chitinase n=1 Tax=Lachancea thermotolerans (strain ATCC 56472 / CBS 6340 / NRRL Y-8284) TaxID=559295 RepID=C5DN90_LACTC|nr:KLTH0G15070p [Lachancea thermotolerans CBS 6340]CAR25251.1 KLTH0G15070p [Lachancea thermotolerans CBS 6340]
MLHFFLFFLLRLAFALGFDASSKSNVAVYWGQASAGSQESLASYCQSDDVDIVILSFLYSFPNPLELDFSSACSSSFSDGLLHCEQIAKDIKTCQGLGKKVLLSMGGATGSYGFSSDSQAEEFADTLWNTFAGGSADERPFDDAVVDGFDFDIENSQPDGYAALAKKLRQHFDSASKDYYLSAAPQCFYPDASVGDLLENANIDFAFVQFYNNYCNVDKQFNWDTWLNFAQSISPNSNIKLYLGLPGSSTAAGSGYISDLSLIKSTVQSISGSNNFGGIMLWDASQGFTNEVDGATYAAQMKKILSEDVTSASSSSSSSVAVLLSTSTSSTSSAAAPTSSSVSSLSSATSSTSLTPSVSSDTTYSTVSSWWSIPTSSLVAASHVHGSQSTTSDVSTVSSGSTTQTPSSKQSSEISTTQSAPSTSQTILSALMITSSPSSSESLSSITSAAVETSVSTSFSSTTSQSSTLSTVYTSSAVPTSSQGAPATNSKNITTTLAPTTVPPYAPSTTPSVPSSSATGSWAHQRAKELNAQFAAGQLNGKSDCQDGEITCSADGKIAICNYGSWVYTQCADGTTCFAYDNNDTVYTSCNFSYMKDSFV